MNKNSIKNYQICTHCIMDTSSDPDIKFDEKGVYNHCKDFIETSARICLSYDKSGRKKISLLAEKIKKTGRNKKYDCVVGLSGGVDSTFTAYQLKKFGLRPLAVHLDNGWNSELAVNNIEKNIKKTWH